MSGGQPENSRKTAGKQSENSSKKNQESFKLSWEAIENLRRIKVETGYN